MNGKLLLFQDIIYTGNQSFKGFRSNWMKFQKFALLIGILSISSVGFGQTGPAGVNSGIKLWLDASDLDGDGIIENMNETGVNPADSLITQWRDKSVTPLGTGPLFTVPATYTSPKYKPYDAAFDGLTSVDFTTTNALSHSISVPWSGSHTIFIVFKQKGSTPIATGTSIFSSGTGITNDPSMDDYFRVGSDSAATTSDFTYHTTTGTGTAQVITESVFGTQATAQAGVVFYSATRAGNAITTYENGTQTVSETLAAGGDNFNEYVLNLNRDGLISNDCYIAEIIIYDIALTGEALQRVHDYLNCKYIAAFAGPGPGGVDPCNISLWLKADAFATNVSGGGDVDDWYDQSSYGFHADETGGNRPTYVDSDNNFNASLNFDDAANERLNINSSPVSGTFDGLTMGVNPFSIYAIAKVVPTENGTLFGDDYSCDATSGYRIHYSQGSGEWNFDGASVDGSFVVDPEVDVATDTAETPYSLISFKRDGFDHTIQTQDGDVGTVTSSPALSLSPTTGANLPTERWVGKKDDTGGGCGNSHFDGNISEIIIVRSSVSADEDKRIQSYLGLKYGLTIPSTLGSYMAGDGLTDLWTFSSHWSDVAGLGEDTLSTLDQRVSKSEHPSALVTMSTSTDFTSLNDASRPALGHGNYLVWGNNNTPATAAWNTGAAPNDFAILPTIWRVKKTGTLPTINVQVDVDNPVNDMPSFVGDLYLVHGPDLSLAVPAMMTETSPGSGIWTVSGINFSDSAYFTFAVRNDLSIEFSAAASASIDEETMGTFPDVLGTGVVNVPTSFDVDVVGGSATNAVSLPDYTYSDQTYMVSTGTYSMDVFTLTPPTLDVSNQDLIEEGLETAIFQIVLGSGITYGDVDGVGGAVQVHTMTITDDDSYQIAIGTPVDGAENGANATFEISMVGVATNTSGADITGTLTYAGTATEGVGNDYTGQTTFTIAQNAASTMVTLPILDDTDLEGSETIIATIATTVGAVPSTPTATTNIIDDEETGLQISIGSPVDALEDGGTLSFTVSLGVSNQTGAPVTGDVVYTGVAIDGTDFNGTGMFSVANGASIGTVTSNATPDDLVEPAESVIATISNPSIGGPGAIHPTLNTATAFITDEDTPGLEISISAPVATVVEGVGVSFDYLVEMDNSKINGTGGDITGTITLSGTAVPNPLPFFDYSQTASFSFAIPNGSGSTLVTINVVDDGAIEAIETVIATISGLSHGVPNAVNDNATVSIIDDDAGGIFISIGSPTDTTEGPASPGLPFISFEVFIEGGSLNTTGVPITGDIIYSGGSAMAGSDFTAVPTFSIPVGANSTIVQVEVLDDFATEPPETVIAILNASVTSPSTGSYANVAATANIADDDASNITVSIGSPVDGAEGGADASFTVFLDGGVSNGTGIPITGTITYSGTADNADFDPPAPTTVFSIANGDFQQVITLPVFDDAAVEGPEDFIVAITQPSVGAVSALDSVTLNIADNDDGLLLISINTPVDGIEGGPQDQVTFNITMEGGLSNGTGGDLEGTVTYTGTATENADFDNVFTFAIPDGASSVTHTLDIFDDLNIETTESVIATISNPDFGAVSATDTDTAYIFDNDSILTELNIVSTLDGVELPFPATVDGEFTVSLAGGLINELGVPITGDVTLTGTATEGAAADYVGVFAFSIPSTAGSTVLTMAVVDDALEEPTETITATISNPSIGIIGAMDAATIEIMDGDTDLDNDGLIDLNDPNVGNIDSDCDGIFDGCDADADGDGTIDPGMVDTDGDGINDGCDADIDGDGNIDNGPDINGDGLNDVEWDPTDSDFDLLPDHVDPNDNNPDSDGDGIPDGADVDVDGDGINDNGCDDDLDGIHNVADSDDSPNDGLTDAGNLDVDNDGIDNYWDLVDDSAPGQAINYIVSPDGDGINETLFIKGIQLIERHELSIFNRWGVMIYYSINYNNDWAGEMPEAISIGSGQVIEGTYFYTLDLGNGEEFVRGYIEVRR